MSLSTGDIQHLAGIHISNYVAAITLPLEFKLLSFSVVIGIYLQGNFTAETAAGYIDTRGITPVQIDVVLPIRQIDGFQTIHINGGLWSQYSACIKIYSSGDTRNSSIVSVLPAPAICRKSKPCSGAVTGDPVSPLMNSRAVKRCIQIAGIRVYGEPGKTCCL